MSNVGTDDKEQDHDKDYTLYSCTATMSFPRVGLRFAQQMRSPTLRSTFQRRFQSTSMEEAVKPGAKLVGPADNAFNRERAAVKAHAAATSGMNSPAHGT